MGGMSTLGIKTSQQRIRNLFKALVDISYAVDQGLGIA
ncbi:hypothetical protein SAMN05216404_11838 [Nitrosospira multiformis]|uniref:Uncharacterized protein n=1 Tax=Nitrosospira multiformis TaxID=1231 RepID=A0A1H8P0U2_9PROT|nr:hypothetical protein SAMN05216404_11838 [Nitrosospira multiformis]